MSALRHVWGLLAMAMAGCGGEGAWQVTTWGEDYIESGIPSAEFADGCTATFDTFLVGIAEASLLDGDGEVAASLEGSGWTVDLVAPGPHDLGAVTAPAAHYDTARFVIAPVTGASSLSVAGSLACGAERVTFSWEFATETTYLCAPDDLTLPRGGVVETELTVHGDHFFYDDLESPDAVLRGQALVDADAAANADGVLTLEELSAVPVAPLGYGVGQHSSVTDLAAFLTALTQGLGHVNGEGHCQVLR